MGSINGGAADCEDKIKVQNGRDHSKGIDFGGATLESNLKQASIASKSPVGRKPQTAAGNARSNRRNMQELMKILQSAHGVSNGVETKDSTNKMTVGSNSRQAFNN